MGNDLDPRVASFNAPLYAWSKIKRNAKAFHIIHSDNDPYVPLVQAEKAARRTGTHVEMIESGGHLNASAGFTAFPYLRAVIMHAEAK
jgi:predicted alpha/beta hydrolase family esterase